MAADQAQAWETHGEVYRVWLDGRRIDLSRSHADDVLPLVSPDGRWIAFISDRNCQKRLTDGACAPSGRMRLYVVRNDGRDLRPVSGPLPSDASFEHRIAWSPDNRRIAVSGANGLRSVLLVTGRGVRQHAVARAPIILNPSWSADGRRIAFFSGDWRKGLVTMVSMGGRRVAQVPGANFVWWRNRLVVTSLARPGRAVIRIYDASGQLRARFPGRTFALSPDGRKLASVAAGRLEVRAADGRHLFDGRVPGLQPGRNAAIIWVVRDHIAVVEATRSNSARTVDVNLATHHLEVGNQGYDNAGISPDQRLVAEVHPGPPATLSVSRVGGGRLRRLVTRSPCPELVEGTVHWLPDGRSLIYDISCQSGH
jgi:Tol biopolymer transport system component